jgi:hypothetical protein
VANNVIAMCIPIKDATTFSHPLVLISRTFPISPHFPCSVGPRKSPSHDIFQHLRTRHTTHDTPHTTHTNR